MHDEEDSDNIEYVPQSFASRRLNNPTVTSDMSGMGVGNDFIMTQRSKSDSENSDFDDVCIEDVDRGFDNNGTAPPIINIKTLAERHSETS